MSNLQTPNEPSKFIVTWEDTHQHTTVLASPVFPQQVHNSAVVVILASSPPPLFSGGERTNICELCLLALFTCRFHASVPAISSDWMHYVFGVVLTSVVSKVKITVTSWESGLENVFGQKLHWLAEAIVPVLGSNLNFMCHSNFDFNPHQFLSLEIIHFTNWWRVLCFCSAVLAR